MVAFTAVLNTCLVRWQINRPELVAPVTCAVRTPAQSPMMARDRYQTIGVEGVNLGTTQREKVVGTGLHVAELFAGGVIQTSSPERQIGSSSERSFWGSQNSGLPFEGEIAS